MYSFDSLTLKYFFLENRDFITNSIVQKIQLPSRYEVILNIRNIEQAKNKKLYININPKYPHICFIDEASSEKRGIEIPQQPPMFCMQLRKYLSGSKIKDFKLVQYERILEIYFDYFDEIGSLTRLCLAVELMGKHSNIILYNANTKIITGSIHNISQDKSSVREIYGGINYIYPPKQNKLDILNISYAVFDEIAKDFDIKKISDNFYYFNQALLKEVNEIFKNNQNLAEIFAYLQKLENNEGTDFILNFWDKTKTAKTINAAIDNYFSDIIFDEVMKNRAQALKKCLIKDYKKLQKTASILIDDKKTNNYKKTADLIMANLYNIKQFESEIVLDNLKIELDCNLSLNDNAQKYYGLYKKAKTTLEYNQKRKEEALNKLEYFENIIFNIENAKSFTELEEIKNELIEIGLINKVNKDKNQKTGKIQPPKLTKIEFSGFEIYLGKNNKQNDYLLTHTNPKDLWFHAYNCPSSHIYLKIKDKKQPTKEVLEFCAKLTKENSKAKNGTKASIIYTERKNLKHPPNTYLGYVTYKNEKEIVI